jgi:transcriptional regulator with GAF, ATPase, and Fis domain
MLLDRIREIERQAAVEEDVAVVKEALEEGPLPLRIIAESPAMKEVISLVRRMAESPWPVLIQGETGTGKELIAHLLHLISPRKDHPFIEVNCAAVPENLFESELFGHEKGAFTGAVNRRRGQMELADRGTLFLDEIGEMPLNLQPKLLRAVQEHRICRLGAENEIRLDVRLISATNRNLKRMAEEGKFREDLYYRIKVLEIEIPPLRERREEVPALVDFFLERYAGSSARFTLEAMDALIKYPFPGNVRELEHIIQRTTTLARSSVIQPSDLPEEVRRHQATTQGTLIQRLNAVEREMILSALEKKNRVQTQAAELLGISERVLRYKMKKHGIVTENS